MKKEKSVSTTKTITEGNLQIITTQVSTRHLDLKYISKILGNFKRLAIINFGSVNTSDILTKELIKPVILNIPSNVENAINKVTTKRILQEAGIPVCAGYIFKGSSVYLIDKKADVLVQDLKSIDFPAVFKKKAGSKGNGMLVVNNIEELEAVLKDPISTLGKFLPEHKTKVGILSRYFLESIFNKGKFNEVRIHASPWLERVPVFYSFKHEVETSEGIIDASETFYENKGIIFEIQKFSKANNEGEVIFGKNVSLGAAYWSRSKFYSLLPKYKNFDNIRKGCVDAIKALGLDLGAVDVVFTRSGDFAVLEVNTAPALHSDTDTRTLQCYNQAIPIIIEKKSVFNV